MKIPSLFRTPKYQRFNIEPRYYDPIKEEIAERTARMRHSMEAEGVDSSYHASRIAGAFKRSTSKSSGAASLTQFIIMVLLAFAIFGYIYLGNIALYIFVTVSTLLLYLKMRRII